MEVGVSKRVSNGEIPADIGNSNLKVAAICRYLTTNVGKKELPGLTGVACEMLKAVIKEVDDQDDEE